MGLWELILDSYVVIIVSSICLTCRCSTWGTSSVRVLRVTLRTARRDWGERLWTAQEHNRRPGSSCRYQTLLSSAATQTRRAVKLQDETAQLQALHVMLSFNNSIQGHEIKEAHNAACDVYGRNHQNAVDGLGDHRHGALQRSFRQDQPSGSIRLLPVHRSVWQGYITQLLCVFN